MANLRRRIPQQTESLFTENHEPFFNSIDPSRMWRVHRSSRDNGELDQQLAEADAQAKPSKSKGKRVA
jgi:hypothetical protein